MYAIDKVGYRLIDGYSPTKPGLTAGHGDMEMKSKLAKPSKNAIPLDQSFLLLYRYSWNRGNID